MSEGFFVGLVIVSIAIGTMTSAAWGFLAFGAGLIIHAAITSIKG